MTTAFSKDELLSRAETLLSSMLTLPGTLNTPVPGFFVGRKEQVTDPCISVPKPFVSLMLRGRKSVCFPGGNPIVYERGQCMVAAVSTPNAVSFVECSSHSPLLYLTLDLDFQVVNSLLSEFPQLCTLRRPGVLSQHVLIDADENLIAAFLRLLELCVQPERIAVMAPLISKEIHYCLLLTAASSLLSCFSADNGPYVQLAKSAEYIRENYKRPVFVEDLAQMVHMAPSTYFRHFRTHKFTNFVLRSNRVAKITHAACINCSLCDCFIPLHQSFCHFLSALF